MISRRDFVSFGSAVVGGLVMAPVTGLAQLAGPDLDAPDVLIVGAGPAGIVLALELAAAGLSVTLLESGGSAQASQNQALAQVLPAGRPLPYDLSRASIRAIGGGTHVWGGVCPRLQAVDLQGASLYGYGVDWPISYAELSAYYCRAEQFLQVGSASVPRCQAGLPPPYLASSQSLAALLQTELALERVDVASMCVDAQGHYQPLRLSGQHLIHPRIRLIRATAARVELDAAGRAKGVLAAGSDGYVRSLNAGLTVLAAGGVQNARLLMLSRESRHPDGLGNAGDALGRWFMEHPSLHFWVRPREQFADAFSTNAYVHIFHWYEQMKKNGLGSAVMRVGVQQQLQGYARGRTQADHLWMFEAVCEQEPQAENRLALHVSRKDQFNQPMPTLQFAQSDRDLATIARARQHLLQLLEPFAHSVIEQPLSLGSHHLMGVTRMSASPETGVVDADLQVHGVPGLYVVGSSVFPTGGASNPTLTLTALSLRLAQHLITQQRV